MTLTAEPEAPLSPGITRPLIVAFWTYAAGYIPWLATRLGSHMPSWVMPVVGLTAGAIGIRLARIEWSERLYSRRLPELGSVLAGTTGVAMAGWFWYATMATPLHAAMWLVFGALPLGGWYWALHRSATLEAVALVTAAQGGALPPTHPEWTAILEEAGLPGVHVQARETQAGVTLTVRPNRDKPANADDMGQRAKTIATVVAFARPDIELREDDLRIEPAATLPNVLVHISWRRPLRGTLAYVPAGFAGDIREAGALGVDEVGEVVGARLDTQNGLTVSTTGGGKTCEANVKIGRITECTNALVWIGATDKLLPLAYPWLRPWLAGRTDQPLIDWVAGQRGRDVLDMLADVYAVVRLRNARNARKSKHTASRQSPALIVFIEESTDLALRREKVSTFDGRVWTASGLLERICAADRSAGVAVYFIAQAALVDVLGDYGPQIMRNIKLRTCGVTMTDYDGRSTLPGLRGNVDTTKLRDNTLLMQPNNEEPRVFPWKAFHLEDDHMIEPVVIANTAHRPDGIEPEIAAQLTSYAGRWDDGRLPDIVRECEAEGFPWPGTRGVSPADDDEETEPMAAARTTSDYAAAFDVTATVEKIRGLTASLASRIPPPPLDRIERGLEASNAPKDFVSTASLAIYLDRVAAGAPEDEIEKAAWQLGLDVSSAVPALKTRQRNVGGGKKARGYDVARLREVFAAIRAGEEVPAAEESVS